MEIIAEMLEISKICDMITAKEGELQVEEKLKQSIIEMLAGINDAGLLERIHRFVQYIYAYARK